MNIEAILKKLSKERPLFYSEHDFQFALAWKIQTLYMDYKIRLEYPMNTNHLDIFVFKSTENSILFELKYKHKKLSFTSEDGEIYNLKGNQIDYARYDFLKDIERLENFQVESKQNYSNIDSYVLLLTNDKNLWKDNNRDSLSSNFKIHEGRQLYTGDYNWIYNSDNPNIIKKRTNPIHLKHSYTCNWKDYSIIEKVEKRSIFRYLLIKIK